MVLTLNCKITQYFLRLKISYLHYVEKGYLIKIKSFIIRCIILFISNKSHRSLELSIVVIIFFTDEETEANRK